MRKIYDLKNLPDGRGKIKKYPWEKLNAPGSFFIWEKIEDRKRINAAAYIQKIKVSCRSVNGKLHVIRIK